MNQTAKRASCWDADTRPEKFAIYAGDGLYLRSLARQGGRISFGRDQARRYTREGGIAALHIVRRAGRGAWLVPHPGKIAREVARRCASGAAS